MDRRNALSTLAAVAAGGALYAAARPQISFAAAAMGEAEMKHAKDTMMVGSLSLATSRVALTSATTDKAKQFAKWEVAEQETIADILKSMEMAGDKAEGALHPPTEAET